MTTPRVVTEELGGSPLARAAQREELPQWYRRRPTNADAWRAYVHEVALPHATGAWLKTLLPALEPTGDADRRLRHTAANRGVLVTTGQQAALFGGPLYTLLKALSALAIADAIERTTGVATAPVFWAATDDADFQEAACAKVALEDQVRALCIDAPARPGIPMSAVPLGDVGLQLAALAEACGSVADASPLAAVRRSHDQRATLGDAYVRLLRALLEPLGIAVLDASHRAVREAGGAILGRALERAVAIEETLSARTDAILAAGFRPQVELVRGLSLVFAAAAGGEKWRVPIGESATAARGQGPDSYAPNVLLRPLVERAILPSAAYVAGPGEIAYFAQVSAVADQLDVPTPLVLPRWSATILESRIERALDRLGVRREELSVPDAVESRLARMAVPEEIQAALEQLRSDTISDVAALEAADSDHLVSPATLAGLQRWVLRRIERVARRYGAAMKRRELELMRDVATVRAALYPEGKRQERVLNFIPFLARNGGPLLDAMRAEAARHATAIVGSDASPSRVSDAAVAERV